MGRIENTFKTVKAQGEKALVIYITAGDPSLEVTKEIALGLDAAGVDCLEIGVPFSDPTADGPIIQAASQRALKNGTTLSAILDMIESIREVSKIPIVLFGYYNPILSYGTEQFAARAQEAGVDGILVVDLPPEEAHELRQYTDPKGIACISLIAPTTSTERAKMIASHASGFLYYISITGVTGTAKPQVEEVAQDIKRIRTVTELPLVVGFGISTPQQATEIAPLADGIVIGSAVVRMIEEPGEKFDLVTQIAHYAKEIKAASQPANPPKNR